MDNVITTALRDAAGADVAVSNGFRFAPPTAPGPITEADLWNWLPLQLELKTGQVSGAQLHAFVERELEQVLAVDSGRLFGGWLPRVAGLSAGFFQRAPPGERIVDLRLDGMPIDFTRDYTIVAGHRPGAPEDHVHRVQNCHHIYRHRSMTT